MIPVTRHFNRIHFPFRMLRYCNETHHAYPVPMDFLGSFQLISEKPNDARVHESIWLFMFIGVDPPQIQKLLEQFENRR